MIVRMCCIIIIIIYLLTTIPTFVIMMSLTTIYIQIRLYYINNNNNSRWLKKFQFQFFSNRIPRNLKFLSLFRNSSVCLFLNSGRDGSRDPSFLRHRLVWVEEGRLWSETKSFFLFDVFIRLLNLLLFFISPDDRSDFYMYNWHIWHVSSLGEMFSAVWRRQIERCIFNIYRVSEWIATEDNVKRHGTRVILR
jgi:hypothetical protein